MNARNLMMTGDTKIFSTQPLRFLTYPELAALGIRYSRKHLLDLMRAGKFPQARQLSPNRVAWRQSDILAYLESRPVRRDKQDERSASIWMRMTPDA